MAENSLTAHRPALVAALLVSVLSVLGVSDVANACTFFEREITVPFSDRAIPANARALPIFISGYDHILSHRGAVSWPSTIPSDASSPFHLPRTAPPGVWTLVRLTDAGETEVRTHQWTARVSSESPVRLLLLVPQTDLEPKARYVVRFVDEQAGPYGQSAVQEWPFVTAEAAPFPGDIGKLHSTPDLFTHPCAAARWQSFQAVTLQLDDAARAWAPLLVAELLVDGTPFHEERRFCDRDSEPAVRDEDTLVSNLSFLSEQFLSTFGKIDVTSVAFRVTLFGAPRSWQTPSISVKYPPSGDDWFPTLVLPP